MDFRTKVVMKHGIGFVKYLLKEYEKYKCGQCSELPRTGKLKAFT